jgi:amidase
MSLVERGEGEQPWWNTAVDSAANVRSGRTTARALAKAALDRIAAVDKGIINSVIQQTPAEKISARVSYIDGLSPAEKQALPLCGVPITIKEHINVAGLISTGGSETHPGTEAEKSAPVVTALEAAGAIVIGKTNIPLYCADYQSYNKVYGRTSNPHDLALTPGGSSGGSSAAVCAGLVSICIGTDIGGSVRVPAHFCGIFAHKPTWGLISKEQGDEPVWSNTSADAQSIHTYIHTYMYRLVHFVQISSSLHCMQVAGF